MPRHLQINASKPRIQYRADGVRCEFLFPFAIFADTNLEVYLDDQRAASGFTVRGVGESEGGSIVFASAPAAGVKVTLRRRLVVQRTTDFQESGPFRARVLNDELDYLTAAVQQLESDIERTVRLAPTDADAVTLLPDAAQRAGRAITFDSNGNVTTVLPRDLVSDQTATWRSLDDIPEGTSVQRFSAAEKAKLATVESGAQVNAPIISPLEKAQANERGLRSFSPKDVADMVAIHAPVYDQAVLSVHGRTGAVVAQPGDYTAEQIVESGDRVVMTAGERAKLADIQPRAQVNPERVNAEEKSAAASEDLRGFAPVDVRDMIAALAPAAPVTSIAGRIGDVVLNPADVGLEKVTNDAQIRADLVYPAKPAPVPGDKLIVKDQADGQPKVVDWSQLPTGAVASVHGRIGAVTAQPGDYTAEQIAETENRVVMTAAERAKLAEVEGRAQANPPAISEAEKAAPLETVTLRLFSPKDIADLIAVLGETRVARIDGGSATTVFPGVAA